MVTPVELLSAVKFYYLCNEGTAATVESILASASDLRTVQKGFNCCRSWPLRRFEVVLSALHRAG